ncbi:cytochrome b [Acidocella aquatica]|uniref:Cytochrome b n=1 Tax=Acidocella aquatica TaxID=1922313 RepID=A0ABQ6A2E0_9PROT|nr:cytochrome b [Acidocella aquatica]GLR65951.1 cytochrome b [Acidocella aquatica]
MNNATAPARYDGVSIILHWATAALVVLQFGSAETWDFFPKAVRHVMITGHMSFGVILTAVIALRVLWRLTPGYSAPAAGSELMDRAAKAMHHTLYALIAAEVPLGFFTRWTDNHALSFFGLLIASPFGTFSKAAGGFVDEIHDLNAWLIMILVAGHALAALYHHYLLRDDILRRMLPRRAR